ncbi:PREDICTED: coiled-coil domain-containing protein 33 [Merops nubicus]|uniref:coiled-coil domain-containing protein 33 n=1 Tax=Merops nubicus TaxID=57421 RepID=UPI0004F0A575|nr:PREDICTED: coiled-coil domain-containing protein 33 [Merops nubicus]
MPPAVEKGLKDPSWILLLILALCSDVSCQLHQDMSLPAADAVGSILPGKQLFPRGTGAPSEDWRSQDTIRDHQEPVSARETGGARGSGGIQGDSSVLKADPGYCGEQSQAAVNPTLLASSYRLALRRMAGDLLSLRQHVTSLEVENGHLRHSLAPREDLGHALLANMDLDVMTREELLDRLATLKCKLVASTAEMKRLKDRVQQLQNELIRKNDQEKDLVLLQRAHRQQQAALKRSQEKVAKMKGLEETVRQQEKVIELMERVLQEKLAGVERSSEKPAGEGLSGEVYAALLAENHRLQEKLERPPHLLPPITPWPPALPGGFRGTEKLSLLAKLEEAQARRRVLEKQVGMTLLHPTLRWGARGTSAPGENQPGLGLSQLEEAARRWGREKQELSTRLLEQEHGFPHTPASVSTCGDQGHP